MSDLYFVPTDEYAVLDEETWKLHSSKEFMEKEQDEVIFYTIGCPMCQALKRMLDNKKIRYKTENNIQVLINKGFTTAPMLEVNGRLMNYSESIGWIIKNG